MQYMFIISETIVNTEHDDYMFTDTNLFTFSHGGAVLFLNMQNAFFLLFITFVCLSVPHTVF